VIADVRRQLERVPFAPFSIRMSDGRTYPVPTVDHIYIPPRAAKAVVSDDEGVVAILSALHMTGVIEHQPQS
jgi:hypothetical protein